MPKKEDTPLQSLQKEGEALQKKVNAFDKEVASCIKKAKGQLDSSHNNEFYGRCQDLKAELDEVVDQLEELDPEAENMKENKFEGKKKDETKKHKNIEEKLGKIEAKLEPVEEEESEEDEEDEDDESVEDEGDTVDDEESLEDEETEDEDADDEDDEDGDSEHTESDKRPLIKAKAATKTKAAPPPAARAAKQSVKGASKPAPAKKQVPQEEEDDDEDETEYEDEDDDDLEDEETELEDEEGEEEETEEDDDEDDEDEDDEDDSEEESEEGSEEEETDMDEQSTMRQYEALEDFQGEQDGDLTITKGEILTIIMARSDGWLEAENSKGHKGLVPITFLKVHNKYGDLEESEEEEDEDESEDEPSGATPHTPKSARDLWKDIKNAVSGTSATDVLHALGAMPAGFRESTLAKLRKLDKYSLKSFLTPKLSQSCVSFRDLYLDSNTELLRPRTVKVQKVITIIQARQIPLPGTGVEVLSRHVRICLFDGQNVLSNIHTIKVSSVDKDQKTWNFSNKVVDVKKSIEFGELFIRTNSSDTNIGLLVELCVTFKRASTGKEGELSCGWVHFKLFDQEGRPMPYKTYDEFVNGGTIYEKGVDVDPSVGKKAGSSKFRTLMAGNKQPRLVLRITDPTKDQKSYLDVLPDVLISGTPYIAYLAFYRYILGDLLLRDRDDLQSTELIYGPLLKSFPEVAEQPDLMDVLRTSWAEELKVTKRMEKKDMSTLKEKFRRVFFQNVYPLVICATLQPFDMVHEDVQKERLEEIQHICNMNKGQRIPISLLSADIIHKPLDIADLSFNIVNSPCTVKAHGI